MDINALAWNAESLRLSVFLVEPIEPASQLVRWKDLVGTDPDQTRTQHFGQVATAEGLFNPGRLRLGIGPSRFDWHLTPNANDASTPLLDLGAYESALDAFGQKMRSWLEDNCPPVHRVAYAPVLIVAMESLAHVNRYLNEHLESLQLRDADQTTDLEFRFNIRKPSKLANHIQINRLAKWSAAEVRTARVEVTSEVSPNLVQVGPSASICRLELDINTAPENTGPLSSVASLFDELVNIAFKIAQKGDRT